jgi:peptide/nickel transport system permease protein
MRAYLLNRLLLLVVVVFGVTTIVFVVTRVLPHDPVSWALGPEAGPEQVQHLRRQMRLDRPLVEQYLAYLADLIRGDFGFSFYTHRPVRDDLVNFFPATFELALVSMALTIVLSVPLGVAAARSRGGGLDLAVEAFSTVGAAVPVFWLALMLQFFFYGKLGWLPAGDRISGGAGMPATVTGLLTVDAVLAGRWAVLWDALVHLALPALTLALQRCAVFVRIVRAGMLEVLHQDYIRTARAKGLAERRVVYLHGLKNASLSVLTLLGLHFGYLLGGSFLVEVVFQWPGLGQYAVGAITKIDYSPIAAIALVVSLTFVVVNLITDLLYSFFDPRVRY